MKHHTISAESFEALPEADKYVLYQQAMLFATTVSTLADEVKDIKEKLQLRTNNPMTIEEKPAPRPIQSKQLPTFTNDFNIVTLSDSMWKHVTPNDIAPNSAILSWPGATTAKLLDNIEQLDCSSKTAKTVILNIGVCDIGAALQTESVNAEEIVNGIKKCVVKCKQLLNPEKVIVNKLSKTTGKYQNFNEHIDAVNLIIEANEANEWEVLDLELFPELLHDGIHPKFPDGVSEIVRSTRKILRKLKQTVASHYDITTPRAMRGAEFRIPNDNTEKRSYQNHQYHEHHNQPQRHGGYYQSANRHYYNNQNHGKL